MTTSASIPLGPAWIHSWPGLFNKELGALRGAGTKFTINEEQFAAGVLLLDIEWMIGDRLIRLKAIYPESFPWMRPQVFLTADAADMPERHCNPLSGELCLLGRDTRQWNVKWTLQDLLERQLEAALDGSGEEDRQAEPIEVWWNGCSAPDTGFCLVDSSWRPRRAAKGTLEIAYAYNPNDDLRMRACAIKASGDDFSATFAVPAKGLKKIAKIPWIHLERPLLPRGDKPLVVLDEAVMRYGLAPPKLLALENATSGYVVAISYPMEIAHGAVGTGWLFAMATGHPSAVKKGRRLRLEVLQTLRAGVDDMRVRDPDAAPLVGKRIVIAGAGALGAPIALGLARSGCSKLALIDHDLAEPGNSIRWVAGYPAWGVGKANALKTIIETHYQACDVEAHPLMIGSAGTEVAEILAGADLVIDATAAYGATMWLGAHCKAIGIPLLTAMAWADRAVDGGAVGLHAPTGGCPHCLDFLEASGDVPPLGPKSAEPELQPPGCSERTFVGAAHDLQEISLQVLRMVPIALDAQSPSLCAILSFEASHRGIRLPRWQMVEFEPSDECGCSSHA